MPPLLEKVSLPNHQQDGSSGAPLSPLDESSDSEYQHALEVIFDEKNARRRRSSLVPTDSEEIVSSRRKNTECYVHALLESHRRQGRASPSGLEGIAETLAESRVYNQSGRDAHGADTPITRCNRHGDDDNKTMSPGNEDAKSWQQSTLDGLMEPQISDKAPSHCEEQTRVHSRLLTKKQLSDMASGVRELSQRLGRIRLKLMVKKVFLLAKAHDESMIEKTREITRWLLSPERRVRYTVWVEETLKAHEKFDPKGLLEELAASYNAQKDNLSDEGNLTRRLKYWKGEMCRSRPDAFDFVVTLGGDGTVLYASWLFQRTVPPVLSFSLGSLGFLTKFDYNNYESTLRTAFKDGITISLRLRFEATVMRSQERNNLVFEGANKDGCCSTGRDLIQELVGEEKEDGNTHRPDGTYEILNEIVIDRGPNATMSSIEIFGDDMHYTSVSADGVCVATPTGSTAYNLAAGGSLCHPENPVILVTAICAHTLSFRPIILPDTTVLRVGVPYDARTSSWASFDGRERVELKTGDYVTVLASRYPFASVMPPGVRSEDWISTISSKLGWNTRQRQKIWEGVR